MDDDNERDRVIQSVIELVNPPVNPAEGMYECNQDGTL
jgi:hypothetical protein